MLGNAAESSSGTKLLNGESMLRELGMDPENPEDWARALVQLREGQMDILAGGVLKWCNDNEANLSGANTEMLRKLVSAAEQVIR